MHIYHNVHWLNDWPLKLDRHGGHISVHYGPVRLAAALQDVPPGLQPFLGLLVQLLQPVRLAATQHHSDNGSLYSTHHLIPDIRHHQTTVSLPLNKCPGVIKKKKVLYLISAMVWAACTCFPRGDSTLSLSIWHRQYLVLKALLSYRIACEIQDHE